MQQEIETVDPLLILVDGLQQRISLPEQESSLIFGPSFAFIRQELFRHCRIAARIFQIAEEQNGLFVRFSHPVHLLGLISDAVSKCNAKNNYSKYFLPIVINA